MVEKKKNIYAVNEFFNFFSKHHKHPNSPGILGAKYHLNLDKLPPILSYRYTHHLSEK